MHEVVSKLTERTQQGRIPWKKTASKTSFAVVFGNMSVLLSARTSGLRSEVKLSVLDEKGDEIDHAVSNGYSEDHQSVQLQELYRLAKHKTLGPDPRLEELAQAIDRLAGPQ